MWLRDEDGPCLAPPRAGAPTKRALPGRVGLLRHAKGALPRRPVDAVRATPKRGAEVVFLIEIAMQQLTKAVVDEAIVVVAPSAFATAAAIHHAIHHAIYRHRCRRPRKGGRDCGWCWLCRHHLVDVVEPLSVAAIGDKGERAQGALSHPREMRDAQPW